MAEAVLDVQDIAYCTLDIEGSRIPPTMNFVDSIFVQDGFGIATPVLQLWLNDQRGTLSADMNIQDGTLVTLKLAKTREQPKTRKFRIFGFRKQTTAAGPKLVVTCILDTPKWSAGVFTEGFKGTSADAIKQVASRAGLKYDGPKSTDDSMTWLNVNKTRAAFTEDVAMRGFASGQSCMARLLTMDLEVRYKDLFDVLKDTPKFTFLQNTQASNAKGKPIVVRETQDASISGIGTHAFNYGQMQYQHSLDDNGQGSTTALDAPLLGAALPINGDVRGQISERGARVNYTGWDTGTYPKAASNLHHKYEPALYQNTRYLALFSERIALLSDEFTEAQTLDCVEYLHADQDNHEFKQSQTLSGKWLLGGKTLWIKAGHKYSEIFYLYRAAINESGASNPVGTQKNGSQQNAKANNGPIDLVAADQAASGATTTAAPPTNPITVSNPKTEVPAIQAAHNTLTALKEHAAVNPLIPSVSSATFGSTTPVLASEDKLRNAVTQYARTSGPLRQQLVTNQGIDSLLGYKTLKKVGEQMINIITNGAQDPVSIARNIERLKANPNYLKSSAITRLTNAGSAITGVRMNNIVSAAQGRNVSEAAIVGDVIRGGIWADDLRQAGISPTSVKVPLPVELEILENPAAKFGTNFLYSATGLKLTGDNVMIQPYQTARNIERWASETDPSRLLVDQGARSYMSTFGTISPREATTSIADIGKLAAEVAQMYNKNEVLADSGLTDSQYRRLGKDVAFTFGDPTITPVVNSVDKIVQYGQYHDVTTKPTLVTWAQYYSMGSQLESAAEKWKFPFQFPTGEIKPKSVTNGFASTFDESTQKWMNS